MVYITKFRANDLNPSKGKQIEFNAGVVANFFGFTESECTVTMECRSLADNSFDKTISANFKLSPARGDYKIYQNDDGSPDLKDVFLTYLHLTALNNIDDYYAIKKKNDSDYILYYIPKDLLFKEFFPSVSGDQLLLVDQDEQPEQEFSEQEPYQIITYGAPGTGKSFQTKCETKDRLTFRTTFHPDSDYSTFVGAYKPTKEIDPYETVIKVGTKTDGQISQQDALVRKSEISYDFVPQAFIRAYVAAWKKYVAKVNAGGTLTNEDRVYLVIEEINRGHCAQIFGDLFQLLDRNDLGFSDYPIDADADLAKWLRDCFAEDAFGDALKAMKGYVDEEGKLVLKLCLPPNLYIRATMNTSDQSLFPMDSAFKRRWDWKYVPISEPDEDGFNKRKILCKLGGENNAERRFDWWEFLGIVNEAILKTTKSEDKQLGYFFVKVPNDPGEISAEKFAGKVLFYLYNDVFKDYNYPDAVFAKKNMPAGSPKVKYSFKDFFDPKGKAKDAAVAEFLENLGVTFEDNQLPA